MQTLYSTLGEYFDVIVGAASIDTEKEVAFLNDVFKTHDVHSVLDIACGTGRHSVALAEEGYEVVGVDYSEELLKVARSKSRQSTAQFFLQDVAAIKLENTFDAAICMWSTFGELPYKQMLKTLKSALRSGGLFVIDVVYYRQLPTGTNHKFYTSKVGDITIDTNIRESFEGRKRTSDITYDINGRIVHDSNQMDIFTESEYIKLLDKYGFRYVETYYDYSLRKNDAAKRLQIMFSRDK